MSCPRAGATPRAAWPTSWPSSPARRSPRSWSSRTTTRPTTWSGHPPRPGEEDPRVQLQPLRRRHRHQPAPGRRGQHDELVSAASEHRAGPAGLHAPASRCASTPTTTPAPPRAGPPAASPACASVRTTTAGHGRRRPPGRTRTCSSSRRARLRRRTNVVDYPVKGRGGLGVQDHRASSRPEATSWALVTTPGTGPVHHGLRQGGPLRRRRGLADQSDHGHDFRQARRRRPHHRRLNGTWRRRSMPPIAPPSAARGLRRPGPGSPGPR